MNVSSYLSTGDAKDCTGCAACAYACPIDAISMTEDAFGFEYPKVDGLKCIHCDRCLSACHMRSCDELKNESPLGCYGAVHGNSASINRSASGGVATALSLLAIDSGGIVYGCVTDREDVYHERLTDHKGLCRAQGSKYVQSDLSRVFASMGNDLKSGRNVVFVGTPCQCAAIKTIFGKYQGLMTVDLVCEGVPSRQMYADFLDDLETERGERVTDFRFRDKCGGWSTKNAVVLGEESRPLERQHHSHYYYYYLFSKALILRDSCYACPYACARRVGDITVGDLWGAETAGLDYGLKELYSGISCVLSNTRRGGDALEIADIELRKCDFDEIARSNGCLREPSSCDQGKRSRVLAAYLEDGAAGMRCEYQEMFNRAAKFKADIAAKMPLPLRVALKRVKAMKRACLK